MHGNRYPKSPKYMSNIHWGWKYELRLVIKMTFYIYKNIQEKMFLTFPFAFFKACCYIHNFNGEWEASLIFPPISSRFLLFLSWAIPKWNICLRSISSLSWYPLIKSAEYLNEISIGRTEWGVRQKGLRGRQRVAYHWSGRRSIGWNWSWHGF